jgi:hypothetical protein
MPGFLQGALDSKMPKMTFEELGFVAHAMHKVHFHLRTPNKSIASYFAQVTTQFFYNVLHRLVELTESDNNN